MLLIFFSFFLFCFEVSVWLLGSDSDTAMFGLFSGSLLRNYVFPELHRFKKGGCGGLCADEEVNKKALEFQSDAKRNRFMAAGRNCF